MRRTGGLLVVATLGWLVVLAGLAAFAGSLGSAPTRSPAFATGSLALGSSPPTGSSGGPTASASPAASAAPSASRAPDTATLVGAGDIASCGLTGDTATALLVEAIAGTVFTAGDNAYENGTAHEF
ncbi:MAG: hypothetical protein L0221_19755, partial [Chloroflexi bacterium]|nr:hypothetical protein [Chloroflexota bacterium]